MPPVPKFFKACGKIGSIEVLRNFKADEPSDTDGYIRIARKIAENLHRIGIHGDKHGFGAVKFRALKNIAHDVFGQIARQHNFFEQTA